MKKLIIVLCATASIAQAVDLSEHYRPEQYQGMSDADKALVVTDTRSTALNNRTAIDRNHDQAMDLGYDNYQMLEGHTARIDSNMYGMMSNTTRIKSYRADIDHNRYLIDNIKSGQDQNTANIKKLESKVNESVALSSAFAALPRAYRGGSVIGAGLGHFNGKDAVAIGAEHSTGNWSFNVGVSSTSDEQAYKLGTGYHW